MSKAHLILTDCNTEFCDTASDLFNDTTEVLIECSSVEKAAQSDCIVCVGNSIGEATNPALFELFNQELEERIQDHILMDYEGNQPIGTAFLLETFDKKYPFLIYAPITTDTNVTNDNKILFHAARSILLAVRRHNIYSEFTIHTILWPDITSSNLPLASTECAQQLKEASDFIDAHPKLLLIPIVNKECKSTSQSQSV